MTTIHSIFILAVTIAFLAACGAHEAPVESPRPLAVPFQSTLNDSLVAATVEYGGSVDTFSSAAFQENLNRLNVLFPEVMQDEARSLPIRQEMVRQYVLEKLLMHEAARRGLEADSGQIAAEMTRYKSRFQSEDDFLSELAEIHQSEDDLRSQFASTISRDALIRSIEDSLPVPSAQEIEAFQKEMATRLRVQHVLIGVPEDPSAEDLERSRELVQQLVDSLDAGKSFSMLARRFSDDPGSKVSGGELPWFRRGEMVPEFEKAAFALEGQGDYTQKPVRTPYGYHLIKLLERVEDNTITADSALALLMKRRVRDAHENLQRQLVEQAIVRTNPAFIPPSPANLASGG